MHPADKLCRPVVTAIIRKKIKGISHILMQTRWKPKDDPHYSGTLELPAGHLYPYENVYEALKREVFEETGLGIRVIKPSNHTKTFTPRDDAAFGFQPFCSQQQLKNGLPWIGFTFLCEVKNGKFVAQKSETRDQKWIPESEIEKMVKNNPEKIFTFHLPPLAFYFQKK